MLITDRYAATLQQMHETNKVFGSKGDNAAKRIQGLIAQHGFDSVLDYGCGKGALGRALKGVAVSCYDPAVPRFASAPRPADLVVCRDVMEHVEEGCVENVLRHIHKLALKMAWFLIVTQPSKEILPDGRNAHITLKSCEEWGKLLDEVFANVETVKRGRELEVICLMSR